MKISIWPAVFRCHPPPPCTLPSSLLLTLQEHQATVMLCPYISTIQNGELIIEAYTV